jgi:hypothetical protein
MKSSCAATCCKQHINYATLLTPKRNFRGAACVTTFRLYSGFTNDETTSFIDEVITRVVSKASVLIFPCTTWERSTSLVYID